MKITIVLIILFIGTFLFAAKYDHIAQSACAYEESCNSSPASDQEITLVPTITISCTPTPELSIPFIESSPTPLQNTPISTISTVETQIEYPASANNTQSSRNNTTVNVPSAPPMTGRGGVNKNE